MLSRFTSSCGSLLALCQVFAIAFCTQPAHSLLSQDRKLCITLIYKLIFLSRSHCSYTYIWKLFYRCKCLPLCFILSKLWPSHCPAMGLSRPYVASGWNPVALITPASTPLNITSEWSLCTSMLFKYFENITVWCWTHNRTEAALGVLKFP